MKNLQQPERRDCNTIFQEALLLIHAILPSFKKCPVLNELLRFRRVFYCFFFESLNLMLRFF